VRAHADRPSFGLSRRAPTEPAAFDKDDLVLIGQRALFWKRLEAPAEAAVDKSAGTPSPQTSMCSSLTTATLTIARFAQSETPRLVRSLKVRLPMRGCGSRVDGTAHTLTVRECLLTRTSGSAPMAMSSASSEASRPGADYLSAPDLKFGRDVDRGQLVRLDIAAVHL